MRMTDVGKLTDPILYQWFTQVLNWSKKKVSFQDNLDIAIIRTYINVTETIIEHGLGRTPQGLIPFLEYPNSALVVEFTRAPTQTQMFLKRTTAGQASLIVF